MSIKTNETDRRGLQRLLHKIALKRFYDNITREMKINRIQQKQLSLEAGRHDSAFNKSFKNLEDIRLTTFLRYWQTLNHLMVQNEKESLNFQTLLDDLTIKALTIAAELFTFEPEEVAKREREYFIGLKAYVEGFVNTGIYDADSGEVLAYQDFMSKYINEEDESV